jgi:hypothetical protein
MVPLTGGVSANIDRLDLQTNNGLNTSVVLREHGSAYSGHPANLEFKLLKFLHQMNLAVPKPLYLDTSQTMSGFPVGLILPMRCK